MPAFAGVGRWTTSGPYATALVTALAVDPTSPAILYAGTRSGGVFKSADAGQSWDAVNANDGLLISISALAIHPSDPSTLYAGIAPDSCSAYPCTSVAKSTDGGANWSPVLTGFQTSAIAIDPASPSTIYAAGSGIQKSYDGGAHWSWRNNLTYQVYSLLIDSLHTGTLYAGTDFLYDYYAGVAGVGGGIFKSDDGGTTWQESTFDLDTSVVSLAMDPVDHSRLYAAARSRVYSSGDAGWTWSPRPSAGLGAFSAISAIAIDPVAATTLYLATDGYGAGVYRSLDAGASWAPFNEGLSGLNVKTLAIDPAGRYLHAGTAAGVFDYDLSPAPTEPCVPGPDTLCLLGGRFRVTLFAMDDPRGRTSRGAAVAQGDRFGYFSLPDFTGDETLPEVVVKMVDGTNLRYGSFWFFHAGLTGTRYALTVTDTATGRQRVYQNDGFCGTADTQSFPGGASSASLAEAAAPSTLSASGQSLSLLGGRFLVSLSATRPSDHRTVEGSAIAQGDRFGYFSLPEFMGDASFPEVCVKMIDATGFDDSFWFFYAGLTSLPYTLTVRDTVTGAVKSYESAGGDPSRLCGSADTKAFPESAPSSTVDGAAMRFRGSRTPRS